MEYQSPPTQAAGVFPFSSRRGGTEAPRSDLRSPGKISRFGGYPCTRWEFGQKNREQERSDMGESVFPETDPISLFLGLLIYLLLYRYESGVTWGSTVLTFIKIRCFT